MSTTAARAGRHHGAGPNVPQQDDHARPGNTTIEIAAQPHTTGLGSLSGDTNPRKNRTGPRPKAEPGTTTQVTSVWVREHKRDTRTKAGERGEAERKSSVGSR